MILLSHDFTFGCERDRSINNSGDRGIATNAVAASKDKKIAESLRPGYEWEGRIIRPEIIVAYVYREAEEQAERSESDDGNDKKDLRY